MRIFTYILAVIVLVQGCTTAPLNPTEFNEQVTVNVEINDSIGYDKHGRRIVGQQKNINGICYLKLPTIRWLYDVKNICVWGHEFMHCVLGTVHTEDDEGTCW